MMHLHYSPARRTFRRLSIVVLCALFCSQQALANAGGVHPMATGKGGSNSQLPDVSDPNANLPTLPTTGNEAPEPKDAPAANQPHVDPQTCDPTLDLKFYKSLEQYYCLQSASGDCPKGLQKLMRNMYYVGAPLFIGWLASTLVQGAVAANEAWLVSKGGQAAQALRNARDEVEKSAVLREAKYAELRKQLLEDAKTPSAFRNLVKKALAGDNNGVLHHDLERAAMYVPNKWTKLAMGFMMGVGLSSSIANEMNVFAMGMNAEQKNECKSEPGAEWTAHDPANQCRAQYAVTGNVSKFLDLPHDQKMEILDSNPAVCQYYKDFNSHLLNWLKPTKTLTNISCGSQKVSYEIGDGADRVHVALNVGSDGQTTMMSASRLPAHAQSSTWLNDFNVQFADHGNEHVIEKISFDELPGLKPTTGEKRQVHLTYPQLFDDSNSSALSDNYRPTIVSTLTMHKLYSELVKGCCSMPDDAAQSQCKSVLEKPDAKNLNELGSKSAPATGSTQVK